jgi:hypothetical protein
LMRSFPRFLCPFSNFNFLISARSGRWGGITNQGMISSSQDSCLMRPPDKHASCFYAEIRLPAMRSDPHGIKATPSENATERRNTSGPTDFPATGSRFIRGKRLHRWQSHSSPIPPALIVSACGERHAEYRAKTLSIRAIRRSTEVRSIPV